MKALASLLPASILASLTLGLAPFNPQPHILEKIGWIMEGKSFAPIDIFDVFLHGTPWVLLFLSGVAKMRQSKG